MLTNKTDCFCFAVYCPSLLPLNNLCKSNTLWPREVQIESLTEQTEQNYYYDDVGHVNAKVL